jgi:putative ABC transport system substrate-binding protein
MSVNPYPLCFRALRTAVYLLLIGVGLAAGSAPAAGLTVLMADEAAAHSEFVRQLRSGAGGGGRIEVLHIAVPPGAADAASAAASVAAAGGEENVTAGVRTRGMRAADLSVTIAVGMAAARLAVELPGTDPLLLAMLSRLDYESLRTHPALRRGDRRVGVLLRDPAMADQLALIDAVLPQKRRLGVVATAESEPLVRELVRAAAAGWDLQVQYAPDPTMLAAALRSVVARSDALMVLPDRIGDNQAAALAVLHAGAGAGLPVFGASDGLVRSGGLAAAVSTPGQLAQQARAIAQKLTLPGGGGGTLVEAAMPATVRVNPTVARGLGLRLPDERELTERVTATR